MTDERAELRDLMEQAGLRQTDLAKVFGVSKISVNRWFVDRADSARVPLYALRFLRVFMMLAPKARASLLADYGVTPPAVKRPAE